MYGYPHIRIKRYSIDSDRSPRQRGEGIPTSGCRNLQNQRSAAHEEPFTSATGKEKSAHREYQSGCAAQRCGTWDVGVLGETVLSPFYHALSAISAPYVGNPAHPLRMFLYCRYGGFAERQWALGRCLWKH